MGRGLRTGLLLVCAFGIVFFLIKIFGIQVTERGALINYEYHSKNDTMYVIRPSKKLFKKIEATPHAISPDREVTIEVIEGERFALSLLSNPVYRGSFTWNIKNNDLEKESAIKYISSELVQPKRKNSFGFIVKAKWATTRRENFSFQAIKQGAVTLKMENWRNGLNAREFDHDLKVNIKVTAKK